MIQGNVDQLALGNAKDIAYTEKLYSLFELVGCFLTALKLLWLREWFSPVVFMTLGLTYQIFP